MHTRLFLLIYFSLCNYGCSFSCREAEDDFKNLRDCNIVIINNTSRIHTLDITGYNPVTGIPEAYKESEVLYIRIYKSISVGDTLFKPRNGSFFLLRKRLYNIRFSIICGSNDKYLGIKQDTLSKSN